MEIKFTHQLPSMYADDGTKCGTYNNEELGFPGILTTLDPNLGNFMKKLRSLIWDDRRLVFMDGRILMCSKNWIRDHVHEMKSFIHWEYNIDSFLNYIIDTQRSDGQFYELVKQMDDRHWAMVNDDCRILFPDDNMSLVRLELEADVEYLVVEGALYCFRVTGDTEHLRKIFPALERGINYITSDPKRWDNEHGLIKRPFSIDTWDFCYKQSGNDRRIYDNSPMSVMHGDNTGVYSAMLTLAFFARKLGMTEKAADWEKRAKKLKENIFRYLWNGRHFIHELHLGHDGADNLERNRLSLSNAYALNRGIFTTEEARSVIEEYIARRDKIGSFAEWLCLDPPYEMFNGYGPGQYVNGAVSPFVAGELARGAFECGYEEYAYDIIRRLMKMAERDGMLYFLYTPTDGTPQDTMGPRAWGAAAILCAIDEGLAGIKDLDNKYEEIAFSPRFPVTQYKELRYITGYEKTHIKVDIRYILTERGMRYDLYSPAKKVNAHILIPKGKALIGVKIGGEKANYSTSVVGDSFYADFTVEVPSPLRIEMFFEK